MKTTESLMACNQLNRCEKETTWTKKFQSIILLTQSENIFSFCSGGTKASKTSAFLDVNVTAKDSLWTLLRTVLSCSRWTRWHKIITKLIKRPSIILWQLRSIPYYFICGVKKPIVQTSPLNCRWYQSFHRLWAPERDFEPNLFSLQFCSPFVCPVRT